MSLPLTKSYQEDRSEGESGMVEVCAILSGEFTVPREVDIMLTTNDSSPGTDTYKEL